MMNQESRARKVRARTRVGHTPKMGGAPFGPAPQGRPGRHLSPATLFWGTALLLFMLVVICVLPVTGMLGLYARATGRTMPLVLQVGFAFGWFVLLYLMIRMAIMLRHLRRGAYQRMGMMDNALEALDRIARGDFDVVLEPDQYNHFLELTEKINQMAQNLSSMEHMRQDFVSNISHEIGSPLTSIQGFATLLKSGNLDEETRVHYLEIIEAECRRLSRLSDNLLKLSLLDNEQVEIDRKPYRLDKQLEHVTLLLEQQWLEKRIDFQARLSPVTYTGDEALMEQLWINLVQNAVKFTPEEGVIEVALQELEDGVVCTVADTGIGISEESLPHIFERFYKADKARERKAGGNGLGLSLAKKIADLHGGVIEVESRLGEGTLFRVHLPQQHTSAKETG